jgi:predicted ATP-grasp superfamily ATP-dependent carboligase
MMEAAERIACRLRLSGFFGLDFVIEDETQAAILIEMNPRCTPACHLQLGETRDMVRHLTAQLTGQATVPMPRMTENDLIAYFPQAWKRKDELFETCFHDIPDQEPDLVKELLKPWPDRTLLYRLFAHLQQMVGAKADSQPELYEEGELIEANCSKRG